MIFDVLKETIIRVAGIAVVVVPVLFAVEYLNHKYGDKLILWFEKRKSYMPFWAALFSLLPGCNAASAVALLYIRGLISAGTLVAAMIATSDEAIYVFIPQRFNFVPLFVAKFVLAVFAGYLFDLIIRGINRRRGKPADIEYCCSHHEHGHNIKEMWSHSLRHSLKVVFYVFLVLFGFNLVKDFYGFASISRIVLGTSLFQPLVAGLFGLIPGCGTSVVLATLYTEGLIHFGAALAGLSVASGDSILILLGGKAPKRNIFTIVLFVFIISVIAGYAVTLLGY
jgi:hypothetical protein